MDKRSLRPGQARSSEGRGECVFVYPIVPSGYYDSSDGTRLETQNWNCRYLCKIEQNVLHNAREDFEAGAA